MKYKNTVYVSYNGSDFNDGQSAKTPFKTIDKAKENSSDNTCILIEGGGMYEGSFSFEKLNNIFIGSYGAGVAVIKPGNKTGMRFADCKNITVSKLKLAGKGFDVFNKSCGILCERCSDVLVKNVEVSGFHKTGIQVSGCKNAEVIGCFSHDNGSLGIGSGSSRKVFSENTRIAYCKVYDNAGDLNERDSHTGSGIIVGGTTHSVVEFCEAMGNGWAQRQIQVNGPVGIWSCCGATDITFRYNIARYNRTQPGAIDGDGFDFDGEVKDSVMEYNYAYKNEGSGYLLCEFWGDCSEVLWENNVARYNISLDDDLRVSNYGSINMSSPQDIPFDKMYIENNFFVATENMHCVLNKNIPSSANDMFITDNFLVTDGISAIQKPDHPYTTLKDNKCIEDNNVRKEILENAPLLTDPRDLLEQPVFELLKSGKCFDTFKKQGVKALFKNNPPPKMAKGYKYFDLQMYGPDTEGCIKSGNVSLFYDNVRQGVVTKLSGAGSEFSTPLPWWDKDKYYIVRATARLQSPDVEAYLFIRDDKGQEQKAFFNGTIAEYSFVEIKFGKIDKWFDPARYIGVKLQEGQGSVFVYSLEFIELAADDNYEADNVSLKSLSDFRSFGDTSESGNIIELHQGSNIEKTLQTDKKKITFKLSCEAEKSTGIVYIKSGNKVETADIKEGKNDISLKFEADSDTLTLGVSQNSDSEGTIRISKIELN